MENLARQAVATNPVGDEFDRLKNLLFRSEARRLGEIEAALGVLDHRVGTPDRLVLATTEVLVDALRRAEVAQHRELAQALAPVVVACIRNEIKNSKDMMVEALYPITGRLVSAGIAVAMAELTAAINARMDNLLSVEMLKLRLQSWRSGRPLSELALIRAQRGKLVRLLYLERGSGQLLGQWQADQGQDERADMISGMIAALTDFARNALGTSGGELRELDLGGRKIYLRTSSQMIVAAEFLGGLAPGQERRLNDGFLNLLDAGHGEPQLALAGLAQELAEAGQATAKPKGGLSPVAIMGLILAAVLAWFAWQSFRHWRQESAIDSALHLVIAAHPELAAYPLRALTQHGIAQVTLIGLVPSLEDKDALESSVKLAALPYAFASSLAIIGTQRSVDAVVDANAVIDLRVKATDAKATAMGQQLASDISKLRALLSDQIRGEISGLSGKLAQLGLDLNETRARLTGETSLAVRTSQLHIMDEMASANTAMGERLARLDAQASALQARLGKDNAATRGDLSAQVQREVSTLSDRLVSLGGELAAAQKRFALENAAIARASSEAIASLNQRLDVPRAKLDEELRGFAVFFLANDTMVDSGPVLKRLKTIAKLAKEAGGIRVVGYSDETGTPARNKIVGRSRAQAIAQRLIDAGVEAKHVVIVSRADQGPLADPGDPTTLRNRRVTLEPLYDDEIQP